MKAPGGRKFATTTTITAFCLAFMGLTAAMILGRLETEAYAGFFAAFVVVVGKIVYFLAKERPEEESK